MTKQEEIEVLKGFVPPQYNQVIATRAILCLRKVKDKLSKQEGFEHYADIEQDDFRVNGCSTLRLSVNGHVVHAIIFACDENYIKFKVLVDLKEQQATITAGYVDDDNASTIYINIAGELFPERYK